MPITMRPFTDERDFAAIIELARTVPPSNPHVVDLPWRISSPVTASGRDAYVWEDENGVLLGFAAWQYWWAALDYFIRPGSHKHEIEEQMYGVMEQRFRELDQERGKPLPYWVEFRDDDSERIAVAEQRGYTLEADYYYVQMWHPLIEPLAEPLLPAGFTIRPLGGMQEVESYVALHRAALMLRRFKAHGAKESRVETDGGRTLALRAYESIGFHVAHKVFRQGKYV